MQLHVARRKFPLMVTAGNDGAPKFNLLAKTIGFAAAPPPLVRALAHHDAPLPPDGLERRCLPMYWVCMPVGRSTRLVVCYIIDESDIKRERQD